MIKLILIDIDNTLLDFDAFVNVFLSEHFGDLSKTGPVFRKINDLLWRQLEEGGLTFSELKKRRWKMVLDELGQKGNGEKMEEQFRNEMHESSIPVTNAMEMLKELSQQYMLCTASNGPYEQQVHRLILAGMDHYFAMHFISEEIGYSKPDPRFFEVAFERINRNRSVPFAEEEILIIGDSLTSDMEEGRRAGIHTCFYNRNGIDIHGIQVDYAVNDLAEIAGLLED